MNFDSARQSKIEAKHSDRRSPAPIGQGEDEDRFDKVAASRNSQNLSGRSILSVSTLNSRERHTINPRLKKVTICDSEAKPNRRGQNPRSERGAPLPKGKGDDEDRFGKAAASRLSPF